MEELPRDMNWKAFADYLSKKFEWFGETIGQFFDNEKYNDIQFRRIDHILSDKEIDGDRIVLNIQDGDPFTSGIESYIVFMNSVIRKKYDCYFAVNKVDYF